MVRVVPFGAPFPLGGKVITSNVGENVVKSVENNAADTQGYPQGYPDVSLVTARSSITVR